ncbi:uncharacterized protein LOC118746473 [Rhagoletis pomonella]|uniref:uncharacterized protein LOC118746473 n=1 Tax=Rhagoletis pomonella TaxID=28610 RepID=UPI001782D031|nr:uncharacterized protein LOC118746473 [Rhagoletis pomonella]
MKLMKVLLACIILCSYGVYANTHSFSAGANLTDFRHMRKKRSLIFNGSGQIKLAIGQSGQVRLADPITWRSLVCSYTLQGGHYSIPTTPLYPWDKWEDTFARKTRRLHDNPPGFGNFSYETDDSRLFVYTVLETLMSQRGLNGHQCLLRSICQNAQVDQHVGVLSEVLDVVLTPGLEDLDESYRMAREAGAGGADCLKLYAKCPEGVSLFDSYLDYI